jgi:hypothetical protein
MTKSQLFYLIKKFFFTKEESLLLYKNFSSANWPNESDELIKFLKMELISLSNETEDIKVSLDYFFILNKIENEESIEENSSYSFNEDEDDDDESFTKKTYDLSPIEDAIKKDGMDKFNTDVLNFILQENPDILRREDSSIFHDGYTEYLKKIGIIEYWQLSKKFRFILRDNYPKIQALFNERIMEYEKTNFESITQEYLIWSKKYNITKHTKATIRTYLKSNNRKLTEGTIDNLKSIL